MASITVLLNLSTPITAYSFNADRSQVAISPGNSEVHIYALETGGAMLKHVLTGHDLLVTSIDWAPSTNRIVSCSQDRNAYVWTYTAGKWQPAPVQLRINRSATFVRWAPNEKKFAVASGANLVSVCYFEPENDWWISKHLRKPIRGTLLGVAWHPNSVLLATGGIDGCARVFSSFIKSEDERPAPSCWGEKLPFGTLCADIEPPTKAWIHALEFTPNGEQLAFLSHDSTLHFYNPASKTDSVLPLPSLPPVSMMFSSSNEIIAAGHGYAPLVIRQINHEWVFAGIVAGTVAKAAKATNSALAKFKAMDNNAPTKTDAAVSTVHHGLIREVRPFSATTIATGGVDGRLVLWDTLGASFKELKV